jgi:hypothetical protein
MASQCITIKGRIAARRVAMAEWQWQIDDERSGRNRQIADRRSTIRNLRLCRR